jgi:hypothetical protein
MIKDYNDNIIEELGLTELQVLNIVSVWYFSDMINEVFKSNLDEMEVGEVARNLFDEKYEEIKLIRDSKSLL